MAIIKSPISRAVSTVKSIGSSILGGIKSLFSGSGLTTSNNTATAISGFNNLSRANTATTTTPTTISAGSRVVNTQGTIVPQVYPGSAGAGTGQNISVASFTPIGGGTPVYGPQLPRTINSGPQKTSSGGPTATSSLATSDLTSFSPQTRTLQSTSFGSGISGASAIGSSVGTSPVVLPSKNSSVNPRIDSTPLSGGMAGMYKVNPDGSVEKVEEQEVQTLDDRIKERTDILDKYGLKPSVESDPEIQRARAERQRIQQALQAPTSELNAIVAQQQADLLQFRKTGAEKGATKADFSQFEAATNYNAAIRALPLQASIASLQGDLKLAQDYLTELTQIKQEQINNQYEHEMLKLKSIDGVLDERDRRESSKLSAKYTNELKQENDLIAKQYELSQNLMSATGITDEQKTRMNSRIWSSRTMQDAITAAGQYGVKQEKKTSNGALSILDIQRYQELYPEAGVVAGDTEMQANAKVVAVNTPEAKTRSLIMSAKDNGNTYKKVIDEINKDTTIKDKEIALAIAKEVYGIEKETIVENPVFGTGKYSTIPLSQELERMQKQNIELGVGENTGIREDLAKRGYSVAEIDKAMHPITSMVNSLFNSLFK